MYKLLKAVLLFLFLAMVFTPALLWTYQVVQFNNWQWDLSRMGADRIVATVAKAMVFSAVLAAILARKPLLSIRTNSSVA